MIRFARLLAASAIGTGIGIGLILCLSLNPLIRPTSGGAALPVAMSTDPCASPISNNTDVQALFELHCAVHSAIFDDGEWPSTAYSFEDGVEGPGLYDGVNHEEKEVMLHAIYVLEADLENEAPGLFAAGVTAHMVIGQLHGSAGQIPVMGMMLLPTGLSDDESYVFMVAGILTGSEFDVFEHAAALAGGVMVQEENDGFGPAAPPGVIIIVD